MIYFTYAIRKCKERRENMTGFFETDHIELRKIMAEKEIKTIKELSALI